MTTHYLNTDLELDSRDDLTSIVEAFGEDVVCHYNGPWGAAGHNRAAFELAGYSGDVSSCVRYYHALVEGLPPQARSVWDSCSRRTIDIGFEAGRDRDNCQQTIELDALELLASMRVHLVLTVYPPR